MRSRCERRIVDYTTYEGVYDVWSPLPYASLIKRLLFVSPSLNVQHELISKQRSVVLSALINCKIE